MIIVLNMTFPTNCGDTMNQPHSTTSPAVCDADIAAVLEHLARYRLTTFDAVCRLPQLKRLGRRGVRHVLRHGIREGLLVSASLHNSARYWALAVAGAARCGLSQHRSGTLSETARIRAYAILHFCCLGNQPSQRLLPEELKHNFPDLYRTGMPGAYYFDASGAGRIGLCRVDGARHGRWDRIIAAVREDINLHLRLPGFQRLIAAGRFDITLLTILPCKARRIAEALVKHPEFRHVPVRVVAQPALLSLIASSHRKEKRRKLPRHGFHRSRPGSTEKQRVTEE